MLIEIKLGSKVKDPISGLIGIAVGRTVWLYGCARISVQPIGLDKNKKPFELTSVDEPQLEVIKTKKIKEGNHKTGGPKQEIYQRKNLY